MYQAIEGQQLPWETSSLTDFFALQTGAAGDLALPRPTSLPAGALTPVSAAPSRSGLSLPARVEREIPLEP